MKKTILFLMLVAISMTLFAHQKAKVSERDARRAARQEAFVERNLKAIAAESFSFLPQNMIPTFSGMVTVSSVNNYISVYPNMIDIEVPYPTSVVGGHNIRLELSSFDYHYKYNIVDDKAYVTINLNNVMHFKEMPIGEQSANYVLHFEIFTHTGNVNLTIVPNFSSPVTYNGFLQTH